MQVLSKEEEIKRCQDTVTRLILAFRGLDQHDRSGRSALDTVQIWPSFQLNVKSPPVGGLLIT